MIEVIKDKEQWDEQLALVEYLDFYHTYDYHYLSKKDDELPILIKYKDGNNCLILPLLMRSIENTAYNDATSVYGYAGILTLHMDEYFNKENFHNELNTFFNENNIVSVFSRLHPYLENEEMIFEGLGIIRSLGNVVYVDLTKTLEEQRAKFNKRLKSYLNKSRNLSTVIDANTEDYIETFIKLYELNMKRVDAEESYFFPDSYFYQILSSNDFESELKLCVHNETQAIIGGAIFIKKGNIVQYHLSALSEDSFHIDVDPIKLVIDEMRIKATKEGFKYFNLGGGRGSSDDSLFRFKSGFSKEFKPFKLWKYIVNEEVYRMLVKNHVKGYTKDHLSIDYFPAYRIKLN